MCIAMYPHLNIPVELLIYVLRKRKTSQLRLLIYLKFKYPGQIQYNSHFIESTCRGLDICERSFHNHYRWLRSKKWITVNARKGILRVKSFESLRSKAKRQTAYGAVCNSVDLKNFKSFVAAAVITYFMRVVQRANVIREYPTLIRRSVIARYSNDLMPVVLPNTYLAKVTACAKSTASSWKRDAMRAGYLKVTKRYKEVNDYGSPELYRKYCPDDVKHRLRKKEGKLYIQEADGITSSIVLRKRRRRRPKIPEKPG